jgi:hypothetical protein
MPSVFLSSEAAGEAGCPLAPGPSAAMVHKPIKRKPARIRIKGLPAELDDLVGFDLPKLGTEMELAVLWENLKQEAFSILEDKFIVETSEKGQAFDTATVAKFKAIRSATVSHALNPKCPSATNLSERQDSLLTSRTTTARLALLRAVVQMEAAQEDAEAEKLNARKSPETSTPASAMGSPRTHRGKGAGRKSSKSPGEDKKFAEQGPRSLEPEPVHAIVSHHPPSHIPLEDRLRLACITSKWHPVAAGNASVATAAQRTFEVLGSRRRLTDISSVVRSRIEDREYTEVAENGNKLPTIKVEFVEDDARYKGKGTVVMNHLTPTVLTAFVAYANEPTVRQNELVARGELFRRKNNLSAMSDAKKELDSDRLEKLVCLRELEKLHKSRTVRLDSELRIWLLECAPILMHTHTRTHTHTRPHAYSLHSWLSWKSSTRWSLRVCESRTRLRWTWRSGSSGATSRAKRAKWITITRRRTCVFVT